MAEKCPDRPVVWLSTVLHDTFDTVYKDVRNAKERVMAEGDQVRPEVGPGYAGRVRGPERPPEPALAFQVQYPQPLPAGVIGLKGVEKIHTLW